VPVNPTDAAFPWSADIGGAEYRFDSNVQDSSGDRIADKPGKFRPQILNISEDLQRVAEVGVTSSSLNITGNVSILWEKHTQANSTYAYAVDDLDGDNKSEVLVTTWSTTGNSEISSITAFRGYDGYQLWNMSITGTKASIGNFYLGDLTGDGRTDVIVKALKDGIYDTTALRGYDGNRLWNRSTNYYDLYVVNLTGDNGYDVLLKDSYTVTAIRGYNGSQLWSYDCQKGLMFGGNYEDVTGDGKPDVLSISNYNFSNCYSYNFFE